MNRDPKSYPQLQPLPLNVIGYQWIGLFDIYLPPPPTALLCSDHKYLNTELRWCYPQPPFTQFMSYTLVKISLQKHKCYLISFLNSFALKIRQNILNMINTTLMIWALLKAPASSNPFAPFCLPHIYLLYSIIQNKTGTLTCILTNLDI